MLYSKSLFIFVFLVCLLELGQVAPAQSGTDEFGVIPGAHNPQLGPDSSKIAFLWKFDNSNHLIIYDINGKNIRLFPQDENSSITHFRWLAENKITCAVSRQGTDIVQLIVKDIGTGARITADIGPCLHVHIIPSRNATSFTVAVSRQKDFDYSDLYSVDIATGNASLLIKNPGNITSWTCDTNGTPYLPSALSPAKDFSI
jgi:tricorn protease-like protein